MINELLIKEIKEEAYNKGLEDAWELAQRINCYTDEGGISQGKLVKIFESGDTCKIMCLSYEEALAKLKAYEEQSKIEVGDVVKTTFDEFVVTYADADGINGFDKFGGTYNCRAEDCKKTGKHIDIQSIFEQISEV